MSDVLLQTKLFKPPLRPSLVSRTRLIEQLNHNNHSKLTLISAPAGFGKTTLVTTWLADAESRNDTSCWLSLDEGDNEVPRFFTYLIAAIRTAAPDFGRSLLSSIQAAHPLNETAVTRSLLNQLAELNQSLNVVLDDYHLISNTAVHDVLTVLIEYLPPHVHFIITSREDPQLPLPRWRVRGQLTEIRAADLRFNTVEAADFFEQTMGLQLDPAAVISLESRTEGWAAGLQLAALSLQDQPDPAQQVASFSGRDRHIADYLLSEVLYQQSLHIQQFLLQTAVLERFCAPLCDALLAHQPSLSTLRSQDILERLETTNLFLIPLDNQRRWYRYHHLFADLLRERLRRDVGETAVRQCHRWAAKWYAGQNLREEAIYHAFRAEDADYAGQLVAEMPIDRLWEQGRASLVRRWANKLPPSIIEAYPRIAILAAIAHLIIGDIQAVTHYLQSAENRSEVEAEWHLLEAVLMRNRGQVPQALEFARHALEGLDSNQHNLRTFAHLQLVSNFLHLGELNRAERVIDTIRRTFGQIDVGSQLQTLSIHGMIAAHRADFRRAAAIYDEGLTLPDAETHPMVGTLYNGLGFLYFQWHKMDLAAEYYEQAKTWADRTGITDILFDAYLGEANLACWQGNPQIALDIMTRFQQFARQSNLSNVIEISDLYNVLFHLRAGRIETAVQWATASGLSVYDDPGFQAHEQYKLFIFTHISHSQQTGELSQLPVLAPLAEKLLVLFRQHDLRFDALDLLTWMTLLYDLAGNREKALSCLQTAVSYAEPSQIIHPFIARGQTIQTLLSYLPTTPFTKHLHQTFASLSNVSVSPPQSQLHDPLTSREEEVLKYISAGLTNKAIEEKLYISKNTVRTHLKNLYSKLGVNSRTQAIARAHELNLL